MGVILTSILLFILILIYHYYYASKNRLSASNLEKKALYVFEILSEKIYYGKENAPEGKTHKDSTKFEVLDLKVDGEYLYATVIAKDIYDNNLIEKKDIKAKIYPNYDCKFTMSEPCINL